MNKLKKSVNRNRRHYQQAEALRQHCPVCMCAHTSRFLYEPENHFSLFFSPFLLFLLLLIGSVRNPGSKSQEYNISHLRNLGLRMGDSAHWSCGFPFLWVLQGSLFWMLDQKDASPPPPPQYVKHTNLDIEDCLSVLCLVPNWLLGFNEHEWSVPGPCTVWGWDQRGRWEGDGKKDSVFRTHLALVQRLQLLSQTKAWSHTPEVVVRVCCPVSDWWFGNHAEYAHWNSALFPFLLHYLSLDRANRILWLISRLCTSGSAEKAQYTGGCTLTHRAFPTFTLVRLELCWA